MKRAQGWNDFLTSFGSIFMNLILRSLAKQASRRMDATHGLAVIPRDARKKRAPQDEVGELSVPSSYLTLL